MFFLFGAYTAGRFRIAEKIHVNPSYNGLVLFLPKISYVHKLTSQAKPSLYFFFHALGQRKNSSSPPSTFCEHHKIHRRKSPHSSHLVYPTVIPSFVQSCFLRVVFTHAKSGALPSQATHDPQDLFHHPPNESCGDCQESFSHLAWNN
ncbi:hypothetical protein BC937DRAFT_92409 [Endogone sp. FLAS-F59071]|nr:hypothetical protein BC937DRAFT_92409 [Endogone sp. FLAS-F59071]|eukprot:RUS15471.1 hypothetical protein BC937DRAFT_92409 [Endogone sp. FLAS-F59071]